MTHTQDNQARPQEQIRDETIIGKPESEFEDILRLTSIFHPEDLYEGTNTQYS